MATRRHAPEVVPSDIEGGPAGKTVSMAGTGGRPIIQPFQGISHGGKSAKSGGRSSSQTLNMDNLKQVGMIVGGIWLFGWMFLGYELLWPVYLVLNLISGILSIPPFSWIFGWLYRGAPLTSQVAPGEELTLKPNELTVYTDKYVNQFGDAALIFATHDGYPQIVKGLLFNDDLGYKDLVDARDDAGNTALIYAASKGFRQCTAALLRGGADPDVHNEGGGSRTPLMEAAGGGFRDIVMALRLSPNVTLNAVDDYGNTALHYAAYHGNLAVVLELMKGNPNKDIQNIYGHTPSSYAATNKHKAVVDALKRGPTRSQRMVKEAEKQDEEFQKQLAETLEKIRKKGEEKHVKGSAEDLHKTEKDFAPKTEKVASQMSDAERKSLEDQLARLRRQHEEAELKSQKRIVELLEKSAESQRRIDDAASEHRAAKLNNSELAFRIDELESKHKSSQLRAEEESSRANALHDQHQKARLETESHKSRADAAERERDEHLEASHRHSERVKRLQDEVDSHLSRYEKQQHELQEVRAKIAASEQQQRQHKETIEQLQRELNGGDSSRVSQPAAGPNVDAPASPGEAATPAPSQPAAQEVQA